MAQLYNRSISATIYLYPSMLFSPIFSAGWKTTCNAQSRSKHKGLKAVHPGLLTMLAAIRPACLRALVSRYSTSSINPVEIAHFSRLSSEWWDEAGEFSFLHQMNPVRVRFIREKLLEIARDEQSDEPQPTVLRGLDVLDVGCGGGLLSEVRILHTRLCFHRYILTRAWPVLVLKHLVSMRRRPTYQ